MDSNQEGVEKIKAAVDGEIIRLHELVATLEESEGRLTRRLDEAQEEIGDLERDKINAENNQVEAERDLREARRSILALLKRLEWSSGLLQTLCPVCLHHKCGPFHGPGCELRFEIMKLETELVPGIR